MHKKLQAVLTIPSHALGSHPSFKLRSNLAISSTLVALAIAALTRSLSSAVIKRPAFPAGLGSSIATGGFAEDVVTAFWIEVASAVGRSSCVKKSAFAVARSCKYAS